MAHLRGEADASAGLTQALGLITEAPVAKPVIHHLSHQLLALPVTIATIPVMVVEGVEIENR